MMVYTLYDETTGDIGATLSNIALDVPEGFKHVMGRYPNNQYYVDLASEQAVVKTASGMTIDATSISLGQSVTISGIPVGTKALVDGVQDPIIVDDGELEITPSSIGGFNISLSHTQHFIEDFTVEVT